jgi:hypothetical protein
LRIVCFATGELAIIREISHNVKDLNARNAGPKRGFPVRTLLCATLAVAAFHAYADAPGPVPDEAGKAAMATPSPTPAVTQAAPASSTGVSVQRRADGTRVISTQGDSTGMVNLLNRSMPTLRAREAASFREQEGLRREREAEAQAALVHHTECYRLWGEATCAPKLDK